MPGFNILSFSVISSRVTLLHFEKVTPWLFGQVYSEPSLHCTHKLLTQMRQTGILFSIANALLSDSSICLIIKWAGTGASWVVCWSISSRCLRYSNGRQLSLSVLCCLLLSKKVNALIDYLSFHPGDIALLYSLCCNADVILVQVALDKRVCSYRH